MAKLNLNTYPYYDDFELDKNFHKVLFKPGYAVQARELTQLQTILQDQIKRFGDNIFKEGSVISGCPESTNFNVDVIKILDTDIAGAEITFERLQSFVGQTFIGRTTGVRAVVKTVADGLETTDYKAVFLQYISQGTTGTSSTFLASEIIELSTDSDVTLIIAGDAERSITKGALFSVGDGVVYANGHFIRHYKQTIVLEKYTTSNEASDPARPSKKVGFIVNEEIITSDDDETLLDPAQGSFNYTAPGADRYKLSTELVAYNLNAVVEGFYILYEVDDGEISRRYDRTQYAELNKTLARRTYDESGDYVVQPFTYNIREHLKTADNGGVYTEAQGGDANKLALGIEPGKAYVRGFEYELFATKYVSVNKPIETLQRNGIRISTGYGNYLAVNEVSGGVPYNGTLVNLFAVAQNSVTATTYSNTGVIGLSDVDTGNDIITYTAHPFSDGDIVTYTAPSGSEIGGLTTGNDYYIVNSSLDPDEFQLSLTSGGSAINLTSTGHATQTIRPKSIGTARVASMEYVSGTPGEPDNEYRLYLYDINMTGGSLTSVRSICGDSTDPVFFADISDITNGAALQERVFSPLIFKTTYDYVKTLSPDEVNNSFVYRKLFTGQLVGTGGSVVINLGSGDENFSFTTTTNTTIFDELIVIAETDISDGSGVVFKKGEIIDMTSGTASVSLTPTSITLEILSTGGIVGSPTISVVASVAKEDVVARTKTLRTDRIIKIITTNKLGYDPVGEVYLLADANTGSRVWSPSGDASSLPNTVVAFEYVNNSGTVVNITDQEVPVDSKIYTSNNALIGTVASVTPADTNLGIGPKITLTAPSLENITTTDSTPLKVVHPNWDVLANRFTTDPSLGIYDIFAFDYVKVGDATTDWATIANSGTNVTSSFKIKNGQTDTFYGLGSISGSFQPEKRYVIQFDHFEHSAGSFFTVDSYPLPVDGDGNQGVAPDANEIDWHQIPVYFGTNGIRYSLRDSIDFRVTVANTATASQIGSISVSTINPIGYTPSTRVFTGFTPFYIPHAQEEFFTDIEWNLPRIDRIILDVDGNFVAVQGVASSNPETPKIPTNCMNLGTIILPPYPALSPKVAKEDSRPRHASRFRGAALQRRYTMSDIGLIDSRITSLERYTKLSFLEQKTINTLLYNAAGDERFKNGVLVDSFERATKINYDSLVNDCFVGDGLLTARSDIDPIDLEYSGESSNIYLKPQDAKIVVRQTVAADEFLVGDDITQTTSGATGTIEHVVEVARGGNYKWKRLYLKNVTGSFVANTAYIVGVSSGARSGLITYAGITNAILSPDFRPDLVSVPSNGELATLPYQHLVYTENPYASESITVTNDVVYGYEGSIGLMPAEDVWFEHRSQPQIINHYNTEIIYKEKEVIKEVIKEKEIKIIVEKPTCGGGIIEDIEDEIKKDGGDPVDPPYQPPEPPVGPPDDPPPPEDIEDEDPDDDDGPPELPPTYEPPPAEQQRGGNTDYAAEWIDNGMYNDSAFERAGSAAIIPPLGRQYSD